MIFDSFRNKAFGVQASTSTEHWVAERDTQTAKFLDWRNRDPPRGQTHPRQVLCPQGSTLPRKQAPPVKLSYLGTKLKSVGSPANQQHREQLGLHDLEAQLANLFWKRPHSTYFWFCRVDSLQHTPGPCCCLPEAAADVNEGDGCVPIKLY